MYAVPTRRETLWAEVSRVRFELIVSATLTTQVAHIRNAGSSVGPEAIIVPVTGHRISLDLVSRTSEPVSILGLGAEITGEEALESDGLMVSVRPSDIPSLILSDDLDTSTQSALNGYFELEPPNFVVGLDNSPPEILLLAEEGLDPILPFRDAIEPRGFIHLVLSPVTHNPRRLDWRLELSWAVEGSEPVTCRWNLRTTGDTGMAIYRADQAPESAPVSDLAMDHVDVFW